MSCGLRQNWWFAGAAESLKGRRNRSTQNTILFFFVSQASMHVVSMNELIGHPVRSVDQETRFQTIH